MLLQQRRRRASAADETNRQLDYGRHKADQVQPMPLPPTMNDDDPLWT
jgi:hypothetical protein